METSIKRQAPEERPTNSPGRQPGVERTALKISPPPGPLPMPVIVHFKKVFRVEGEKLELPFHYPGFHPGYRRCTPTACLPIKQVLKMINATYNMKNGT